MSEHFLIGFDLLTVYMSFDCCCGDALNALLLHGQASKSLALYLIGFIHFHTLSHFFVKLFTGGSMQLLGLSGTNTPPAARYEGWMLSEQETRSAPSLLLSLISTSLARH
jgi:hypothetical protein